jgi:hypothetical protein
LGTNDSGLNRFIKLLKVQVYCAIFVGAAWTISTSSAIESVDLMDQSFFIFDPTLHFKINFKINRVKEHNCTRRASQQQVWILQPSILV